MKNLITCLVVCVLSGVVAAEIHHVPADFPTIQFAIDAAVDGDEIIVMPGTYPAGIDMRGKEIWLHSSKGAQVTWIVGGGTGLGIRCDNNETSNTIIEGFTITNCSRGMYNSSSSPTLTNCTFTNNSPSNDAWGGGMYNINSSPALTNCTFENNNVVGFGGGMANEGNSSPTLTNCSFTGNSAQFSMAYDEGRGGGMFNGNSNPTLTNCSFTGNTAEGSIANGGGMCNSGSSPTLTNCSFTNNSTTGGGGGISGSATLINCTFESNAADEGGGAMACGLATITGCVFIQNIAVNGGGIRSSGSNKSNSPTISSSSFCENKPNAIWGNWNNGGGNEFLNTCGDIEGACCVKEACYEVEFLFCDAIGGEWLGYNATCEVDTCSTPPQYGACCINGEAIPLYDYDCNRILGTFMGEGTNPDDVTCPVHCAEDVNGDGLINVSDLLAIISVWGACP